ncbi:DUF4097 family beta strand repeat-containing protein [Bailinhaonella thermotolerans]|uniref:DUF4097 domain-containing protein n=1 Tax=Bailinhaonella thermotolerans TaxID=1070861 RepID=A0A3A4ALA6_9ACTN|nr:DUF4097 family beta strand repeat-containing protein [Bailinhaonella thermotolerans]RJL27267.1 hypothetical protein D5H75_25385 [Bailinhaonella thermotolerans]
MPAFDTPEPIHATVTFGHGRLTVRAADRPDTRVTVRPRDPGDDADVSAAARTSVDYDHGRLRVTTPGSRAMSWLGLRGAVEIDIDLPTGSRLDADTQADVHAEGRLAACALSTASGEIRLGRTGALRLRTTDGRITVAEATGPVEVATAHGEVRIGRVDGPALIRSGHGAVELGEVTGDLTVRTAYGHVGVDRALAAVSATTAGGDIRLGEITRGEVTLETAYGRLSAGVPTGTAAWLELSTDHGTVRSELAPAPAPREGEPVVELRARSRYGDVLVHRAPPPGGRA